MAGVGDIRLIRFGPVNKYPHGFMGPEARCAWLARIM
jgi:hypothetical protein